MIKNSLKQSAKPAVALAVVLAVVVAVWGLLRQENICHATVAPGGSAMVTVETRLQRVFEHKSFAKQRGLPVVCRISGEPDSPDGVTVRVVDTGHRIATMWAKIEVIAAADARSGPRKRLADFEIDGQGRWPQATIVVAVRD